MRLFADLLFAQMQTGTLVLLSAVGLTVAVLLVRSQRGLRPQGSPRGSRPKPPVAAAVQRHKPTPAEPSRNDVLGRNTAVDSHADLDDKLHDLKQLLRAGEALAVRLEALLERSERAIPTERLPRSIESHREALPRPLVQPGTQAAALTAATQTAATRPYEAPMAAPSNPTPLAEPQPRLDEIYALADAGCDSATIAGITGSPVGEVELILSLRE